LQMKKGLCILIMMIFLAKELWKLLRNWTGFWLSYMFMVGWPRYLPVVIMMTLFSQRLQDCCTSVYSQSFKRHWKMINKNLDRSIWGKSKASDYEEYYIPALVNYYAADIIRFKQEFIGLQNTRCRCTFTLEA
jgi:hypothetical protein